MRTRPLPPAELPAAGSSPQTMVTNVATEMAVPGRPAVVAARRGRPPLSTVSASVNRPSPLPAVSPLIGTAISRSFVWKPDSSLMTYQHMTRLVNKNFVIHASSILCT